MVLDRLGAQVQLLSDLLGRASLLEESKHLGLPGREVRGGRARLLVGGAGKEPEDSDDAFTVLQRHRADVQHETRTIGGDQDAGRLGRRGRAEHLAREELARPSPVLGADHGREVLPANVAEQALCRRVDPPDDSRPCRARSWGPGLPVKACSTSPPTARPPPVVAIPTVSSKRQRPVTCRRTCEGRRRPAGRRAFRPT